METNQKQRRKRQKRASRALTFERSRRGQTSYEVPKFKRRTANVQRKTRAAIRANERERSPKDPTEGNEVRDDADVDEPENARAKSN
ncbi:hypothetical protein R1flu_023375 [Riccia fluitans]|uniref:Uncharacterized protein n=1 Tax=Riccia fluitans TaxID=41844 RepID=A0ABD1XVX1_9MARC